MFFPIMATFKHKIFSKMNFLDYEQGLFWNSKEASDMFKKGILPW